MDFLGEHWVKVSGCITRCVMLTRVFNSKLFLKLGSSTDIRSERFSCMSVVCLVGHHRRLECVQSAIEVG